MKALKIDSILQKELERISSQSTSPLIIGALVGQFENPNFQLIDVIQLSQTDANSEIKSFEEYLNQADEQETRTIKILNMISNAKMMLVGGLSLVGILFGVNFTDFETNSNVFKNLVDSIREIISGKPDMIAIIQNKTKKKEEYLLYDFNVKKNLVLLLSCKQRKFSQIDYQFQSFKDRLFKLTSSVEVDLIVSVNKNQNDALRVFDISEKLKQPIRRWSTDISHGVVKVGGSFFDKSETLENIKTKLQQKDNTFECEIFSTLPIQKIYATSSEENCTTITLKGFFTAFAYILAKKVTLKDAFQALVMDLVQSAQDKLNLFVNENEEFLQQQLNQNKIFFLPNRIYFEFSEKSSNLITYCDYLMTGETIQDSEQRLKEWFKLTPRYLNTIEYTNSQNFHSKYLKFQEKSQIHQQEGVTQRKMDKKESQGELDPQEKSKQAKDNNIVKYGVLIGVGICLILIRFLLF